MEVQELIIGFGLKIDDKSLENIKKIELGLRGLTDVMSSTGKIFTGGKSITDFFMGTAEKAHDLKVLSDATGMSVDSIQKWQYAAEKSGYSADLVTDNLKSLFKQMHLTEKGVLSLADSLSNMNESQRTFYAETYGLSDEMVSFLSKGRQEIQELLAEAPYILSDEEIKQADEAKARIAELNARFEKLSQTLVNTASPQVEKFFNSIIEFTEAHPEGTINAVAIALSGLAAASVVSAIGTLAGGFMKLGAAITGVGTALTALPAAGAKAFGFLTSISALLGKISKMGWFGVGLGGATLAGQSIQNLFSDEYTDTWLDKAAKAVVDPLMEKMGLERGFAREWFQPETNNSGGFSNAITNQFPGATFNIMTTEPLGEMLKGGNSPLSDAIINQSGNGPIAG